MFFNNLFSPDLLYRSNNKISNKLNQRKYWIYVVQIITKLVSESPHSIDSSSFEFIYRS